MLKSYNVLCVYYFVLDLYVNYYFFRKRLNYVLEKLQNNCGVF